MSYTKRDLKIRKKKVTRKDLESVFQVTPEEAKKALRAINGDISDHELYQAPKVSQLYHFDRGYAVQLFLDHVLGTMGVEGTRDYSYLNTGDTYSSTLVWLEGDNAPFISTWGDVQEAIDMLKEKEGEESCW